MGSRQKEKENVSRQAWPTPGVSPSEDPGNSPCPRIPMSRPKHGCFAVERGVHGLFCMRCLIWAREGTRLSCDTLSISHKQNPAPDGWLTRENTWKRRQEVRGCVGRGEMATLLTEREVVQAGPGGLGTPKLPLPHPSFLSHPLSLMPWRKPT